MSQERKALSALVLALEALDRCSCCVSVKEMADSCHDKQLHAALVKAKKVLANAPS